jgi:hypothetical protein
MTEKRDPPGHSALDDLQVDPSALEGDPFARKSSAFSSLFSSSRGWVAAGIAVGVLVLAYQFSAPLSRQVAQTPAGMPARLQAVNPPALKQQIVDDLKAAGVEAVGYDRLGSSGVDAQLPQPVPPAVQAALKKHGIPLPADSIVRVEIVPPK